MEANQTEPSDKGEHFPFIYLIKRHNLTFFIDLKSRKMRARSLAIELVKDGVRADKIKGDLVKTFGEDAACSMGTIWRMQVSSKLQSKWYRVKAVMCLK